MKLADKWRIRWEKDAIERAKRYELREKNRKEAARVQQFDFLDQAVRASKGKRRIEINENAIPVREGISNVRSDNNLFESPEEFRYLVEEYVALKAAEEKPPTISGLVIHLGFVSRSEFNDFQASNPQYARMVELAKTYIEMGYEERLFSASSQGASFWLKNHAGYSDKKEMVHSSATKPLRIELVSGELVEGEFTEVIDEPLSLEKKPTGSGIPLDIEQVDQIGATSKSAFDDFGV